MDFYSRVLGGTVVTEGENGKPNVVQLANTWVIINVGGGPRLLSGTALNAALWVAASDEPPAVLPKAIEAFRLMAEGLLASRT